MLLHLMTCSCVFQHGRVDSSADVFEQQAAAAAAEAGVFQALH